MYNRTKLELFNFLTSNQIMARFRIFDNGGQTLDRYTIIDTHSLNDREYEAVSASKTGSGFYQHIEVYIGWVQETTDRQIEFAELDENLQKMLVNEFGEDAFIN